MLTVKKDMYDLPSLPLQELIVSLSS